MSEVVIRYDGEVVFEGTVKDSKVELDFKSGFDALSNEVGDDGIDAILGMIQQFTDKAKSDMESKAMFSALERGALALMAMSLSGKFKENPGEKKEEEAK